MKILTILPHLQTSNVYVQKNIIEQNLLKIHNHITYLNGLKGYAFTHSECLALQKKHQKYLRKVNDNIANLEQQSFAFGG